MKLTVLVLLAALVCGGAGGDVNKGNTVGSPRAPIMMEVFSDFECPACKLFHDTEVPQIIRDYVNSGKVYLIYRYFPLPMHAHGRAAAEMACAAAEIGKYTPVAEAMFAQQKEWSEHNTLEQTVDGVLSKPDQQKLRSLMKSQPVQDEINRDVEEGKGVPVQSTPTVLVTYRLRRYPLSGNGALNYTLMKAFLDDLLRK